jgi:hypothetical protein
MIRHLNRLKSKILTDILIDAEKSYDKPSFFHDNKHCRNRKTRKQGNFLN